MLSTTQAHQYLATALDALHQASDWRPVLDGLPVPVYVTDPHGEVTYWNDACVSFAGREPELGSDRWSIAWHLYTASGEPLAHDHSPMARAIHERREIHNEIVIAERPDGRRIAFRPYPTPYYDEGGALEGAVSLIVDVSSEQSSTLVEQAARCKRLARATNDAHASEVLADMARGYADTAASLKIAH